MITKPFRIGSRMIGSGEPAFIIAEISCNHAGDIKKAIKLIKKAKVCGADAVKFQLFTPDSLTIDIDSQYFRIRHPKWGGQTLYQLYSKTCAPWDWFRKLKKVADRAGIIFFATALDKKGVDFLESLGVPAHKNTSFELVDHALIKAMAQTEKPVILSTGMATIEEIKEAVSAARNAGAKKIVLLKCSSSYPAMPDEMNLKTIPKMEKLFDCPIGLSDHSLGIAIPIAAVALGAKVIEKHITLSRKIKTPDSFFSTEPDEFKEMVRNIRIAEAAFGRVYFGLTGEEKRNRVFRRSLFAVKDIGKGETLTEDNVRSIRPGHGLAPKYLKQVLGAKAERDIKRGTPLKWDIVSVKK